MRKMKIDNNRGYFTQAELKFTVPFSNHRTKVFSRSSLFFVVYNNRLWRKISLSDPYCTLFLSEIWFNMRSGAF